MSSTYVLACGYYIMAIARWGKLSPLLRLLRRNAEIRRLA
jgi:hypothetical protein